MCFANFKRNYKKKKTILNVTQFTQVIVMRLKLKTLRYSFTYINIKQIII